MRRSLYAAIFVCLCAPVCHAQSLTKAETTATVEATIKANGQHSITGPVLQTNLLNLLSISATWGQGNWTSNIQYSSGEIVTYNGALWIGNSPITGTAPGVTSGQWMLLSPSIGTGLAISGGALGINLANANTWSAPQTFPNASITNVELANPSTTVNGVTCTLGSTCTVTTALPNALALGGATLGSNALAVGVAGAATTSVFYGKVGETTGGGTGIVGIGTPALSGYGIQLVLPSINMIDGGEYIGIGSTVTNSPTSSVATGTATFGAVINSHWGGSADSSAYGLVYGSQNEAFNFGTASLLQSTGTESASIDTASGGTVVNAQAAYDHVDNQSTGTITNAYGLLTGISNSGGGTITNAQGIHIGAMTGINVTGLYIDNLTGGTGSNYAIQTGLGLVSFGDAVSAPSATIPTLYGLVNVGDGTTASAKLSVLGKAAQVEDLLDLKVGGVTKFSVDNTGSIGFVNDLNFNNNTAIFGSTQTIRLSSSGLAQASTMPLTWAVDAHAYDAPDTGLSRISAGVIGVGTGTQGSAAGNIEAASFISAGTVPIGTTGSCVASSFVGGATAGGFSAAVCTAGTIILSGLPTAPNGHACIAQDRTTPTDALKQTSYTTTSVTFLATTAAADAVVFSCHGF